ncbi:PP1-complex regulatory subunit GLC8 Ecym_5655 [Eremothecium cymbalariae DBVPG|uniref:Protein GLC8 n=1 Tax=Eremothecium cymbalariae (strain CBS 270.75 / DBVPG 7215 / KCTC 17166 / NRRL Y-17582) TaxID=931890 RepID=I6NE97_ERECY|nr:hypothetical protein Ecym_5655 [Eremothecium cymbalariae DBVPG\
MGGILKNPLPQNEQELQSLDSESVSEFRQQVLKNTRLNAQLTSRQKNNASMTLSSPPRHTVPKDILSLKREQEENERLQWNQKNLDENEITKQQYQDIHVDEPKTPYQGAIDPDGEYYRQDEDEDLDSFTLGDPEYRVAETQQRDDVLNDGVRTVGAQGQGDEGDQGERSDGENDDANADVADDDDDDTDARHKRFEEMRKKHYNVKEIFKNRHSYEDEDE